MRCDQIRDRLAEYLAGELAGEARANVEQHVQGCVWCQEDVDMWSRLGRLEEEQPSPRLRQRVEATIEAFGEGRTAARRPGPGFGIPSRAWTPVWALASLVAGVLGGHLLWRSGSNGGELAELRQEIRAMRQTVAVSLLQQTSASERLRGVNWSYRLEQPDPEVIAALVRTLKYDQSVDVRLAAVDALRRAGRDPAAREGLVEALERQESPLVQLAVIDLLVDLRERRAAEPLSRLQENAGVHGAVRQRAESGLRQLQ